MTGRRTLLGKFGDRFVSLQRWTKNNFRQGGSQDTIDLMLAQNEAICDPARDVRQEHARNAQSALLLTAGPVTWIALMFGISPHVEIMTAFALSSASWFLLLALLFFMVLTGKAGKWVEILIEMPSMAGITE